MNSTLALCIICRNEIRNLPRLLENVQGCFDEIHITDTGSNDGTLEWLKARQKEGSIHLHEFKWIDDFAAARNYSFSHAKTDYSMWLDCDDELDGVEAFRKWKRSIMPTANYWCATYHYGLDEQGTPQCSFMRERVIKNGMGFKWEYFVHEGIAPASDKPVKASYATSWAVKHVRTADDMKADRNRNLRIFEKNKDNLTDRHQYYYGKELFESGQYLEAYSQLVKAKDLNLEPHDKVLCIQYACMAAMNCNQYDRAIPLAQEGLRIMPHRAEFYVAIGDAYLKMGQFDNAIPSFVAATRCTNQGAKDAQFQTPIFTSEGAYGHYPRNQLCRLYFQRGQVNDAKGWLEEALKLGPNTDTGMLYSEILKVEDQLKVRDREALIEVDEYVISCPKVGMYEWNEQIAKTRGIGGSETAAVQIARHLHNMTGKKVRIFNDSTQAVEIDGVFYMPQEKSREYFNKYYPKAHIAWRHNVKLTNAPTFLWCHDIMTLEGEKSDRYDKFLCLSEFHKEYANHIFKVPEEKILVTRNGIDLSRFEGLDFSNKNPKKVVFSSSPDRGLDRAIRVVEKALEIKPELDLELHCFYGFDNMLKLGHGQEVNRLSQIIAARPWVKMHGNVQQNELVKHLQDAKVWLYPTDFLETFCITALEMIACRVHPVVRSWGALPHTLKGLPCTMSDLDCVTEEDVDDWGQLLIKALAYDQPSVDMTPYSWESVAREWLTWLPK